MAISIPVSDLCPEAQSPRPTLVGSAISEALSSSLSKTLPSTVVHLPEGDALDLAPDSVVHIVGSPGRHGGLSWDTHHVLEKARVQGPALVAMETAKAHHARTGSIITPKTLRRTHIIHKLAFTGVILGFVAFVALMVWMRPETSASTTSARTLSSDQALQAFAERNMDMLVSASDPLVFLMALMAGLAVLLIPVVLWNAAFSRLYTSQSLSKAFSSASAKMLGVEDRVKRSEHDAAPFFRRRNQVLVPSAIKGVPASAPQDHVLVIPDGETYTVEPKRMLSYWTPAQKGDRSYTPGHWKHVYCQSSALVYGPAKVAVRDLPKPGYWTFLGNGGEHSSSASASTGYFVIIATILLTLLATLAMVANKNGNAVNAELLVRTAIIVGLLLSVGLSIGAGVVRYAYRSRGLTIKLP